MEGHAWPVNGPQRHKKKYIPIFPKFRAIAFCLISKNKKMYMQIRDECVVLIYN
jgi:hypothetical protein